MDEYFRMQMTLGAMDVRDGKLEPCELSSYAVKERDSPIVLFDVEHMDEQTHILDFRVIAVDGATRIYRDMSRHRV